jgi:hypothetical protein
MKELLIAEVIFSSDSQHFFAKWDRMNCNSFQNDGNYEIKDPKPALFCQKIYKTRLTLPKVGNKLPTEKEPKA